MDSASFNGIDPVTGRGQGFLPITVTPDVGIGNPFWSAEVRAIFSLQSGFCFDESFLIHNLKRTLSEAPATSFRPIPALTKMLATEDRRGYYFDCREF